MVFFLRNKYILLILLPAFIFINFLIINNLGLYNDDWLFYVLGNQSFSEWAVRVWRGEGGVIRRHIVAPIYIILHLIPVKLAYSISIILSCILFFLFFMLFKKLILNNFLIKNTNQLETNLLLLIFAWYFFPFNISGQFWITAIIHTKICTILFLLNILFLIRKKYLLSLIFLALSFNSYEIFFFLYLPITLIFYFGKLIDKKVFKKYLIWSLLIQIFFLFDKIRSDTDVNSIDILDVITKSIVNLGRFIWSIYQTIPIDLNINFIIFIFCILILSVYLLYKKLCLVNNKKFLNIIILLLTISLFLNAFVMSLGNYGYWGKGIFSRTMFVPSFLILFFFCIFIPILNARISLYLSWSICLASFIFFNFEIKNWEKSSILQKEILDSKILIDKKETLKDGKNLILFIGPCYINGVEIFNATWDLDSAINSKHKSLSKNDFIPIQDWNLRIIENQLLLIHIFKYEIVKYKEVYEWNYYENTLIKLEKKIFNRKNLNIYKDRKDCHIGRNEKKRANKIRQYF